MRSRKKQKTLLDICEMLPSRALLLLAQSTLLIKVFELRPINRSLLGSHTGVMICIIGGGGRTKGVSDAVDLKVLAGGEEGRKKILLRYNISVVRSVLMR